MDETFYLDNPFDDTGYQTNYQDGSNGQMRHFWFWVAVSYFDGSVMASGGNFYHDGAATWIGQVYDKLGMDKLPGLPALHGQGESSERQKEIGVSAPDYRLGVKGVELGSRIRDFGMFVIPLYLEPDLADKARSKK